MIDPECNDVHQDLSERAACALVKALWRGDNAQAEKLEMVLAWFETLPREVVASGSLTAAVVGSVFIMGRELGDEFWRPAWEALDEEIATYREEPGRLDSGG